MKHKKLLGILVFCIVILSLAVTLIGIFSNGGPGPYQFNSLYGEKITIYGKGLYQHESLKLGPQTRGQDAVTLLVGIPLLIISFIKSKTGSLRGRLLLAGILGYFLYTYMMFTFIHYNSLFLAYIIIMTISLYAFILTLMSFDMEKLSFSFSDKLPIKFLAGFQIFIALTLCVLWLSDLIPALVNGSVPKALQHYHCLPVYAMDLGLAVPTLFISAYLLIKKSPFGYLLTAIMNVKGVTLLTALTAMSIAALSEGVKFSLGELLTFPLFNVIAIFAVYHLLKNVNPSSKGVN